MSYTVRQTAEFALWLNGLADRVARDAIVVRIVRIQSGLLGDFKNLGDKLVEFRIHVGKGHRLYATMQGRTVILLLKGGDKSSQKTDIARAKAMIRLLGPGATTGKA